MSSQILRTASSSVVPLKYGDGFLEVRRGELRGSQIHDKRRWATQEEWLAAVGEPLVEYALTADQEFVKAQAQRAGKMTKYNPVHTVSAVEKIRAQVARYPDGGHVKAFMDWIDRMDSLISNSKAGNFYIAGYRGSRLYVLDDAGTVHPVYLQPRLNLIGVPQGTHMDGLRAVLKTGRSFAELGITPRSYYKRDGFGRLVAI